MTTAIATGEIRLAEGADIGRIIELGKENVPRGTYRDKLILNDHMLRYFIGNVLKDENSRCIVYEFEGEVEGVFAFSTFPNFFSFGGAMVANMIIWSVAKRFRGRVSMKLLSHGQREARKMGAVIFLLTGPSREFAQLCEHSGYEFFEATYMRTL